LGATFLEKSGTQAAASQNVDFTPQQTKIMENVVTKMASCLKRKGASATALTPFMAGGGTRT
jgi:hypothetical protein